MTHRGPDVVLLATALVPGSGGAANSTKIEAECCQVGARAGLDGRHYHGAVHVAAIEWMGVSDDDPGARFRGDGQGALQNRTRAKTEADGTFRYHPAEENSEGGGGVQRLC